MDNNIYSTPFHSKLLQYTAERIRPFYSNGNCLVCGPSINGEIEKELPSYYQRIICIDKDEDILNTFKSNIQSNKFELIEDNLEAINIERLGDIKFDTILALHILEHLEDPINFLKTLKPLLADKGKIIIVVPNAQSIHRLLGVAMNIIQSEYDLGIADKRVGHKRIFDMPLLKKTIKSAKLKILDMNGIFFKPFHNDFMDNLPIDVLDGLDKLSNYFYFYCADILMVAE